MMRMTEPKDRIFGFLKTYLILFVLQHFFFFTAFNSKQSVCSQVNLGIVTSVSCAGGCAARTFDSLNVNFKNILNTDVTGSEEFS